MENDFKRIEWANEEKKTYLYVIENNVTVQEY